MSFTDKMPIVREGIWHYAGTVPVAVRILNSPVTLGSGDWEDEVSLRESQETPCFFLAYEMAGAPGNFCNIVPNLENLESAVGLAEGMFPGIKWLP